MVGAKEGMTVTLESDWPHSSSTMNFFAASRAWDLDAKPEPICLPSTKARQDVILGLEPSITVVGWI